MTSRPAPATRHAPQPSPARPPEPLSSLPLPRTRARTGARPRVRPRSLSAGPAARARPRQPRQPRPAPRAPPRQQQQPEAPPCQCPRAPLFRRGSLHRHRRANPPRLPFWFRRAGRGRRRGARARGRRSRRAPALRAPSPQPLKRGPYPINSMNQATIAAREPLAGEHTSAGRADCGLHGLGCGSATSRAGASCAPCRERARECGPRGSPDARALVRPSAEEEEELALNEAVFGSLHGGARPQRATTSLPVTPSCDGDDVSWTAWSHSVMRRGRGDPRLSGHYCVIHPGRVNNHSMMPSSRPARSNHMRGTCGALPHGLSCPLARLCFILKRAAEHDTPSSPSAPTARTRQPRADDVLPFFMCRPGNDGRVRPLLVASLSRSPSRARSPSSILISLEPELARARKPLATKQPARPASTARGCQRHSPSGNAARRTSRCITQHLFYYKDVVVPVGAAPAAHPSSASSGAYASSGTSHGASLP